VLSCRHWRCVARTRQESNYESCNWPVAASSSSSCVTVASERLLSIGGQCPQRPGVTPAKEEEAGSPHVVDLCGLPQVPS